MSKKSRNRFSLEARLASSPASLVANFRPEANFNSLEWEQKVLHAWISVREILMNSENAFDLKSEIFNASKEITRSKRRIAELQKQCEKSEQEHVTQACEDENKQIFKEDAMNTAKKYQLHWGNYGIFGIVDDDEKVWVTAGSFGGKVNIQTLWALIPDNLKKKKWLTPVLGNNVWETREEYLISEEGVFYLLDNDLLKKCPYVFKDNETLKDYFLNWFFPKLKKEPILEAYA